MARLHSIALVAALLASSATMASAQQLPQTPETVGMAGAGAAATTRAGAFARNPALLALPGRPRVSVQLPSFDLGLQAGPVGPTALTPFDGQLIPQATKDEWMRAIEAAGGETFDAWAGIRPVGLQVGPIALVTGVIGAAHGTLPPEAARLALYGNAGRTGVLEDVAIRGGAARAWGATTVGLAYGTNILALPYVGRLAVGVTPKYVIGHALADASALDADVNGTSGSLRGSGTVITWGDTLDPKAAGLGLDVGAAFTRGKLTVGLTLADLINTVTFDIADAYVRQVEASATSDTSYAETREGALLGPDGTLDPQWDAAVEARARTIAASARFKPSLHVAARYALHRKIDLYADADLQRDKATGLVAGPNQSLALGAELRVLGPIALRGGLARTTTEVGAQTAFAGGLGLRLLGLRLDAAAQQQKGPGPETLRVSIGGGIAIGGN